MNARAWSMVAVAAAVVPVLAFTLGGWAVVTVEDLPEHAVAGKPVELPFTVRQHGQMLMTGLHATVTAVGPGVGDTVVVTPQSAGSRYTAALTLRHAGEWTVTIQSGFGPNANTLVPITVLPVGSAPPHPLAVEELGYRLFVAKGCVTCHARNEIAARALIDNIAPILTGRRYVPDVLAAFLADPEKSTLSQSNHGQWRMPNLALKPAEIAALVAFVNSDARVASRARVRP